MTKREKKPSKTKPTEAELKRLIKFDSATHKILLEELRYFYTAVTRARVRVFVYDEDTEKREPMYWLLQQTELARFIGSVAEQDDLGFTRVKGSATEDWLKQGRALYQKERFALAATCFTKAGSEYAGDAMLARAEALERDNPDDETEAEKHRRFRKAAEMYLNAKDSRLLAISRAGKEVDTSDPTRLSTELRAARKAARALSKGGARENKHAGELYESLAFSRLAARCYQKAGLHERAGYIFIAEHRAKDAHEQFQIALRKFQTRNEAYNEKALEYVDALNVCRPGGVGLAIDIAMRSIGGALGYEKVIKMHMDAPPDEQVRFSSIVGYAQRGARDHIKNGDHKAAASMLAKLPENKGVDWCRLHEHTECLAELLGMTNQLGEEAQARIQLMEYDKAAALLRDAAKSASGEDDKVELQALRARCLLADAAQLYLDRARDARDSAETGGGDDFTHVTTLIQAATKEFSKLRDTAGELRALREDEIVKGIQAAEDAVKYHLAGKLDPGGASGKGLQKALNRLAEEKDGWGVALLVQATPPAARSLLDHEGWQAAIGAVAETAEALLRAGGGGGGDGGGAAAASPKTPKPRNGVKPLPHIHGMRQRDKDILTIAMRRLMLTEDEVNLAGQVVLEPELNPWLIAALQEDAVAEGGAAERASGEAILASLRATSVPGQTLGKMTAKPPLCFRLGVALLRRAKAWGEEAIAVGERVIKRVDAATSGDAAERKAAKEEEKSGGPPSASSFTPPTCSASSATSTRCTRSSSARARARTTPGPRTPGKEPTRAPRATSSPRRS